MMACVTKLLVLVSVGSLAMPPGWCCLVSSLAMPAQAPVRSCCSHSDEQSQPCPMNDDGPVKSRSCCCKFDAPRSDRKAIPDVDIDLALSASLESPAAVFCEASEVVPAPRLHFGARLHLLQCVWLC